MSCNCICITDIPKTGNCPSLISNTPKTLGTSYSVSIAGSLINGTLIFDGVGAFPVTLFGAIPALLNGSSPNTIALNDNGDCHCALAAPIDPLYLCITGSYQPTVVGCSVVQYTVSLRKSSNTIAGCGYIAFDLVITGYTVTRVHTLDSEFTRVSFTRNYKGILPLTYFDLQSDITLYESSQKTLIVAGSRTGTIPATATPQGLNADFTGLPTSLTLTKL